MPPFMVHERLLPDQSSTLARLMYSAWELGLEGSQPNVAEFLTIATQVISRIHLLILLY